MKLGLKLLQERAKVGSFWLPYIGNLPETYTVPIFFAGEDIKNLQYAPLLYQVTIGGPDLVEGRLLVALRVLLSNDIETVQGYDFRVLKSLSAEAPLGVANEVAVFRTIIALCVIALGHFPTKIMDDESLLKQGVSVSTELALQFRMQKKSLIIEVMRDLTKRVKFLLSKETSTA
ncbi:nudix hydrolase 17 [Hibiscus syriacus]|uniref:Nudix hydrolase 17 n=1 Tax=Hibiscus syriacus TaxID=106335 RepID=A0A6A3D3G6_HIBSY|nr:nudix hydrolase 17 [Hibiscus syriacus]